MRSGSFYTFAIILCLLTGARNAWATTAVNCTANPTTALGTALNAAVAGAVLEITGNCTQSVTVPANLSNLTITNHANTSSLSASDGIEGQLQIVGAQYVVVNGLDLEGTATDTGLTSVVLVSYGATATIQNSQIVSGQRIGLWVSHASAEVIETYFEGNGIANVAGENDGMRIDSGNVDFYSGNITDSTGNGVSIYSGSRFTFGEGYIGGNSEGGMLVAGGSSAVLVDTDIEQAATPSLPIDFAAQVVGASTLAAADNTTIDGGTVAGGAFVASGSSLILNDSTVKSTLATAPALEATGSSNAILAGDNTISNTGGTAIQVDHSSSLQHENITGRLSAWNGPPISIGGTNGPIVFFWGPESVTGAGSVQEESSVDLGQGTISSAPSITWTLSGSEIINVQQNSSFRLSGGVSITGGSGVKIQQGSNAFFNLNNGGSNSTIVICPSTAGNPSAHIANPTSVTPNVTTYSLIAATTGAQATTPNICLSF